MRHLSFLAFLFVTGSVATSAFACVASNDDGERSAEGLPVVACPPSLPAWTPNVAYARGDLVTYAGVTYRCVQGHTALYVWTPDIVPALWEPVSCSGGAPDSGGAKDSGPTDSGSKDSGATDSGTKDSGAKDSGSGTSDSSPPPDPGSPSGTEFAPYFYSWGWGNTAYPFTGLADLKAKSGVSAVTIAFVLSSGGCKATRDVQDHLADVNAFRAAGGHVKVSFGGADGTYLENACGDAASLAAAIESFVSETGVTDLDFDVEQGGAMNTTIDDMRGAALAQVQKDKGVKVAFTLPAFPRDKWGTPGGMTAAGADVVRGALKHGVTISHVNLMTMDYGGYYSTGHAMGDLAVSAVTDAKDQLKGMIPGLSDAAAFAMLGATPMIGQNDVSSEVFSLDDAKTLAAFAKANKVGLLSFWAINRDQSCSTASLALCSEAESTTFAFSAIFRSAL